jgi:hypothetical protein
MRSSFSLADSLVTSSMNNAPGAPRRRCRGRRRQHRDAEPGAGRRCADAMIASRRPLYRAASARILRL